MAGKVVPDTTLMATNSEELLAPGGGDRRNNLASIFPNNQAGMPRGYNRFFCHQVGSAHAKLLFDKLGLDRQKTLRP